MKQSNQQFYTVLSGYPVQVTPLPKEEENRILSMAFERTGIAGPAPAERPRAAIHLRHRLLLVAVLAVFLLAGFTFASRYLHVVVDELPAETQQAIDELYRIDAGEIDDYFAEQLAEMQPGNVRSLEIETDEGTISAQLLRGQEVDTVSYRIKGQHGVSSRRIFDHQGNQVPQFLAAFQSENTLDRYVDKGAFYATLESADYTLSSVQSDSDGIAGMLYTGPGGEYSLSFLQQGVFINREETAAAEDVKAGSYNAVYMQRSDSRDLFIILDESGKSLYQSIGIQVPLSVSKEQLLAAGEQLTLHNEQKNRLPGWDSYYGEAFFKALPDPVLQQNAAAIAQALPGSKAAGDEWAVKAWSDGGRIVSVQINEYDHAKSIEVEFDSISYQNFCQLLPADVSIPFEGRAWFDRTKFASGSVIYRNGEATSLFLGDENMQYFLNINLHPATDPDMPPLDMLGLTLNVRDELIRTDRSGAVPLLIGRYAAPGEQRTNINISTTQRMNDLACSIQLSVDEAVLTPEHKKELLGG